MAEFSGGQRRRYVLLFMVLTSITLATLDRRSHDSGIIGAAGRLAHRVVQPIGSAASAVTSPFHDWWEGLSSQGDVAKDNRKLRRELQTLQSQLRTVADNSAEIKRLRDFFNETYERSYSTVGARVDAQSSDNFNDVVTINRGTESGVVPGMAVLGPAGLVGKVTKSWPGHATVLLISDQTFGVEASLTTSTRSSHTVTESNGRLLITFDDDPKQKVSVLGAKVGGTVITCGCGSSFPKGIPVGSIVKATRSPDRATLTVEVQSLLDRPSLENVLVVKWLPGDAIPPGINRPVGATTTTSVTGTGPGTPTTQRSGG